MKNGISIRSARRGMGVRDSYPLLRRSILTTLREEGVCVPVEIGVLVTDDEGIREINREQREIDAPTDVLSFPMQELTPGEFDPEEGEIDPETGRMPLGDIVLSAERAAAQAREYGHTVERELAYLTVHSMLHLLGYDHMDDGPMRRAMRGREEEILAVIGLVRE